MTSNNPPTPFRLFPAHCKHVRRYGAKRAYKRKASLTASLTALSVSLTLFVAPPRFLCMRTPSRPYFPGQVDAALFESGEGKDDQSSAMRELTELTRAALAVEEGEEPGDGRFTQYDVNVSTLFCETSFVAEAGAAVPRSKAAALLPTPCHTSTDWHSFLKGLLCSCSLVFSLFFLPPLCLFLRPSLSLSLPIGRASLVGLAWVYVFCCVCVP